MDSNFLEKYLVNQKAKEKHADFMLKISENIFTLMFAGLLGVPAIHLIFQNGSSSVPFWIIETLFIVGGAGATWLMFLAIKQYSELEKQPDIKTTNKPVAITGVYENKDKEIVISGNSKISIDVGTSKILIRIQSDSSTTATSTDSEFSF